MCAPGKRRGHEIAQNLQELQVVMGHYLRVSTAVKRHHDHQQLL